MRLSLGNGAAKSLLRPALKRRAGSIFCLLAQRPFHRESARPMALQRAGGDDFSAVRPHAGVCVRESGPERGRLANGLLSPDTNLGADALL